MGPTHAEAAAIVTEDAFSRLAERQMPIIYRYLVASIRDRDLAETLTQECFLKAYRNRSSFRGDCSARTWLMRIALNLLKDHWRSRRVRFWREAQTNAVDDEFVLDKLPSRERSPEAQLMAWEQMSLVFRMVDSLSARERSVFILRYVDELRLSEIGRSTGLKVGAVKVYLARATAKMRGHLRTVNSGRVRI